MRSQNPAFGGHQSRPRVSPKANRTCDTYRNCPAASMTSVLSPFCFSTSASLPTATSFPSFTANAVALGFPASPVQIIAFFTMSEAIAGSLELRLRLLTARKLRN